MPVPDFSPGEVLTAGAMDSIGQWKVTTYSFTNNAAPFIDNCFSADYTNYKVLINMSAATADLLYLRFRNGSGDVITANYVWAGYYISQFSSPVVTGEGSTGAVDYGRAGWADSGVTNNYTMDVMNPFDTGSTAWFCPHQQGGTTFQYARNMQGSFYGTGSMTGIKFFTANGYNLTGTITVYGWKE
jgi:hypothetical protein